MESGWQPLCTRFPWPEGSSALPQIPSAGWHRARTVMAALVPDREAFRHHETPAVGAAGESQLLAARQCHCKKYGVFERDLRGRDHGSIDLERVAQQLTARHAGQRVVAFRGGLRGDDTEQR